MLRIVFTSDDLHCVRVASEPDPMWEIANGLQTLQRRDGYREFGEWRATTRVGLSNGVAPLAALLPPRGYSPDFLTPTVMEPIGFETALDTMLSTPRPRLAADVARLASTRSSSPWIAALSHDEVAWLQRLEEAVRGWYHHAIAPHWEVVRAHVEADSVFRAHQIHDGGVDALFDSLRPHMRWKRQERELHVSYPVDQTLELQGRGLLLRPSFFCWPTPVTLADPSLAPVLVYPIEHDINWQPTPARATTQGIGALEALLGSNRARVLAAARRGCSTSSVAEDLGISAPAVSQHVAVLADAGLLISRRCSGRALHVATPAGRALIRAARKGRL